MRKAAHNDYGKKREIINRLRILTLRENGMPKNDRIPIVISFRVFQVIANYKKRKQSEIKKGNCINRNKRPT